MKMFSVSKLDYAIAINELKTKQQTYLYHNGNKHLIRVDKDGELSCNRCLGNISNNLSLKTSKCAIIDKWGF